MFFPVPPHSVKGGWSKDYFEEKFAPPGCSVLHEGCYHVMLRDGSNVHVLHCFTVNVYTQEELDMMGPGQRRKCAWRTIMVLDGIVCYEGEGEGTGFSGSAGAHSPGSSTARIRLICCHLTAGGKEACIDNPADIHQTAC